MHVIHLYSFLTVLFRCLMFIKGIGSHSTPVICITIINISIMPEGPMRTRPQKKIYCIFMFGGRETPTRNSSGRLIGFAPSRWGRVAVHNALERIQHRCDFTNSMLRVCVCLSGASESGTRFLMYAHMKINEVSHRHGDRGVGDRG